MKYGSQKTTHFIDENSSLADTVKYHQGTAERAIRSFKIKVRVASPQEEMAEFIRFTEELSKLRKVGKLTADKDDGATYPSFIIQYPKEDIDGSYFIVKCYSIFLDA